MHKFVFHNDRILPLSELRLSPGQAGLLNGWGVFTTMRIYQGQPFAFERHWKRLSTDAGRIGLPFDFAGQAVRAHLGELLGVNGVQSGCARIYFVYNKVGFWSSDEPLPVTDLLMYTADLPQRSGAAQLAVEEHGRYAAGPLSGAKVISWLHNVRSLQQAQQRGFDEVILLNERDEVAECTSANLFCVRGGAVVTPPLSAGCLPGVTREVLLEIAQQIGPPITERAFTLPELYQAEEVFITSTTRELQAVSRVEDHRIPGAPGPLTTRLARAFSEYVARHLVRL